jgi:hypothetical protein
MCKEQLAKNEEKSIDKAQQSHVYIANTRDARA